MKTCKRCLLPGNFPGINYNANGVCNFCTAFEQKKSLSINAELIEDELEKYFRKFQAVKGKYDVLVPLSGGLDSSFTLIKLYEKFSFKPLVFHSDHGWDHKQATRNVEELCKNLDIDLIIMKNDLQFMRKLFKYFNEANIPYLSSCFVCGNILYANALEIAGNFDIPLMINGYSKGQADMMHREEQGREFYSLMLDYVMSLDDAEFCEKFVNKWEILKKQKIYKGIDDLKNPMEPGKILFIPFFIFNFYKTDKQNLEKYVRRYFDWKPVEYSYPAHTTNCKMIWLNSYIDLKKRNYTLYHDEYSTLIRAGEISRDKAISDLELIPPKGLIDDLVNEIDLDLSKVKPEGEYREAKDETKHDVRFNF